MSDNVFMIVMMILVTFFVGFTLSAVIIEEHWHRRLLKRKLIQYNPQTGELEWMDGTKV